MIGRDLRPVNGRSTRRPLLSAGPPQTIPCGGKSNKAHTRPVRRADQSYPIRARVGTIEGDVLELLRVCPREMFEVARALDIESPTAVWALDRLIKLGLAERVDSVPWSWRAL